ncbi:MULTISPECIES: MarR family winged helix-turn-helix transcriptional regulator [unclassified Granulicatella]|uniref:MarR family winged helix-turn-helix transcriptional regulator n=1 Tax=unclassified Granulicatella TaxID=2630493 RepID=UPI0013D3DEF8|nr:MULTISPECIES: MarR family transcriptional regulator [unclassified Granulicatella]MBS4750880.1 MarR family transcriptional regulator [Carnobacteriaceae bacterium zg-ZUI78]QMI85565.1 MarR family transcriptional regulator [Carnobacteriaceae bacterium zg-84]
MEKDDCLLQWFAFTKKQKEVEAILEKELAEKQKLSLKEFYVLYFLNEQEEHKMILQQLQQLVGLSQSAMSRMIGRMESSACCAYIKRCECEKDKRSVYICLTEKGQHKLIKTIETVTSILEEQFSDTK